MKKLSIIIPMYNEEENVVNTLSKVNNVLDSINTDSEVIVVNDGSTDRTLEILKAEAQKYKRSKIATYEKNRNIGYALKFGFERSSGDYIITIDSDLSYDAKYILDIYRELERTNFDIIQGSPYMKGGNALGIPRLRLLISKISNRFFSYVINANVHTVTGMLRGYRKEVLDSLYLESNGPDIMMEILSKAVLLNYKIKEIPAILKGRERGKSKFQNQLKKVFTEYFSLLYSDKPIIFFKMIGYFLLLVSLFYGSYLIFSYFGGGIGASDPVVQPIFSLLTIIGALTLFFSIILNQFVQLKKDLLIVQKQNKEIERKLREK
jgi:glycosyltransferase involved in cell wall biosynthesis